MDNLNEIVAEKILGWEIWGTIIHTGSQKISIYDCNPETDIKDAWKIVEHLRKEGIFLVIQPNRKYYEIDWLDKELKPHHIKSETAEKAICLAGLKAISKINSKESE